jgi:hypothetical protein
VDATAIVLTYVLVSMGVIIAFLLAAFVVGSFIGRLRQRRREQNNLPGRGRALAISSDYATLRSKAFSFASQLEFAAAGCLCRGSGRQQVHSRVMDQQVV